MDTPQVLEVAHKALPFPLILCLLSSILQSSPLRYFSVRGHIALPPHPGVYGNTVFDGHSDREVLLASRGLGSGRPTIPQCTGVPHSKELSCPEGKCSH